MTKLFYTRNYVSYSNRDYCDSSLLHKHNFRHLTKSIKSIYNIFQPILLKYGTTKNIISHEKYHKPEGQNSNTLNIKTIRRIQKPFPITLQTKPTI